VRNRRRVVVGLISQEAILAVQRVAADEAPMFFPFHSATMLAIDCTRVIGLRLTKIAGGGMEAVDETQLMIAEKIRAGVEAMETLISGGTATAVLNRYHEHVAANVGRLSRR
jgi:hypothetical protein